MNPGDHSRTIRKLLRKQDSVIEQLDELNTRIEAAIKALVPAPVQMDAATPTSPAATSQPVAA